MTPQQFETLLQSKAKEIRTYIMTRFPAQAGNTALRFIDGNFRAQGWQGNSFVRWKPNKRGGRILVMRGHLRAASYYTSAPGVAVVKNTMPQAKAHNEGATINIPVTPKMRRYAWAMYYKNGGGRKTKNSKAEKWKAIALTKKTVFDIKVEQRQFAPTKNSQSPVLNNAVMRNVERELKRIFPNIR